MKHAAMNDYQRIEKAITYIANHWQQQPQLSEVASYVHLSPFHFQRLFCRWAGTTPKRFLQIITLQRSKELLCDSRSLLDVSLSVGLSGSSRLHDHFVTIEAVTPGEYKNRGAGMALHYGVHSTVFGSLFIAKTQRGICRASFLDGSSALEELTALQDLWPEASFCRDDKATAEIPNLLAGNQSTSQPLCLHLAGTNFQLAVWRALLTIPEATHVGYGHIAESIGKPKASRAVGSAIGANPVAFVIPCHRVILSTGALGQYRWGQERKRAMQLWELARQESTSMSQ